MSCMYCAMDIAYVVDGKYIQMESLVECDIWLGLTINWKEYKVAW